MSSPVALSGLVPFLKPYRGQLTLAGLFLLLAAAATLVTGAQAADVKVTLVQLSPAGGVGIARV